MQAGTAAQMGLSIVTGDAKISTLKVHKDPSTLTRKGKLVYRYCTIRRYSMVMGSGVWTDMKWKALYAYR